MATSGGNRIMKTIYKVNGYWAEGELSESDTPTITVKVPNDINVNFMNSIHYASPDYSEEAYTKALNSSKLAEAKNYLLRTDYVSAQWRDEDELGIEHSRTEAEYRDILEKRQEARELIRSLIL